jgi:predicted RNA-binding Zn-ribbon protein involved in translation (DUF1610 family)
VSRILSLDIETSPSVVYAWGLWDQNIGLNQIVSPSGVLCFAAKFLGESNRKMRFHSVHKDGREAMIAAAHALLDEADVVMHYNGTKFDIPHLNREFVEAGLTPPSPYQQIDLFLTAKRQFRFLSNKLEHVSTQLGLEGKIANEGFDLWTRCLAGDELAWKRMERYNRRDVTLLEELYEILRPWLTSHPNLALIDSKHHACPRCGSDDLQRRGMKYTVVSAFQSWRCNNCGSFSRSTRRTRGSMPGDVA